MEYADNQDSSSTATTRPTSNQRDPVKMFFPGSKVPSAAGPPTVAIPSQAVAAAMAAAAAASNRSPHHHPASLQALSPAITSSQISPPPPPHPMTRSMASASPGSPDRHHCSSTTQPGNEGILLRSVRKTLLQPCIRITYYNVVCTGFRTGVRGLQGRRRRVPEAHVPRVRRRRVRLPLRGVLLRGVQGLLQEDHSR